MRDTTKKRMLFWAMTINLCGVLCCVTAQSALLSVSTIAPTINDSLDNITLLSLDGPYLFRLFR